ncbi:hypothetical protein Salat_0194900 [Sesamum alatum]|uniref:Uncharacterized protein n=1 Tax=Sesamum alatum TaxID=300844 RepID=A0AAE2CYB6_9LAMI|nr:hypothetical protein Salat_0194900 [Sesamum alatum]
MSAALVCSTTLHRTEEFGDIILSNFIYKNRQHIPSATPPSFDRRQNFPARYRPRAPPSSNHWVTGQKTAQLSPKNRPVLAQKPPVFAGSFLEDSGAMPTSYRPMRIPLDSSSQAEQFHPINFSFCQLPCLGSKSPSGTFPLSIRHCQNVFRSQSNTITLASSRRTSPTDWFPSSALRQKWLLQPSTWPSSPCFALRSQPTHLPSRLSQHPNLLFFLLTITSAIDS